MISEQGRRALGRRPWATDLRGGFGRRLWRLFPLVFRFPSLPRLNYMHRCAGLAQAGICDDGGDPDATTGCCSNNKCPTCCTMTSEAQSGDGPKTCTCTGCTGAQVFGES